MDLTQTQSTENNTASANVCFSSDLASASVLQSPSDINRLDVRIESFTYKRTDKIHLRNISFQLFGGKPYTLFGASGSGKSTLLGALLPDPEGEFQGQICYQSDGKVMSPDEVCRNGHLGFMAQSPALLPWCSIRENLLVPAFLNPEHLSPPDESALVAILDAVSMATSVLNLLPHQLSFGMKQRVAFARALLYRPRFLLLDEVYTGLDVATVEVIEKFLVRYTTETSAVALIVTHNLETTQRNAHGSLFLSHSGTLQMLPPTISTEQLVALFASELKYT